MRMRTRLLAAAAAAVFASTGLAAMMPSPASAAVTYCTYKAVTDQSTYVRADNGGHGGYGKCKRVQARGWMNYCGYSNWSTGPMNGNASQVDRGSNCSLTNRQTRGEPVAGLWTGYSTSNGIQHVSVTH